MKFEARDYYEFLAIAVMLFMVMAALGGMSCQVQIESKPDDVMGNEVSIAANLAGKYKADREVRLPDGTRCDLVNAEYAIEVEYPKKWAESIGQSLYYGMELKRKPAVLFLVKDAKSEKRYIDRAKTVAAQYGITVYEESIP